MALNPVVWFELYVEDLDRARRFYEAVLGLKLETLESPFPDLKMLAFPMNMDSAGASGVLAKMEGRSPGSSGTLIYFACDDCEVEASRVEAAGGKLEREKTSLGQYGFMALVIDTEGNMIGFHSQS